MNRFTLQVGLPLVVLAAGGGIAYYFVSNPLIAKRSRSKPKPPLVEVLEVSPSNEQVQVSAMGSVVAAQQIDLRAEVTGRVLYVNPALVPGGRVKAGTTLVRIDPREYKLATGQQEASVERAEFELAIERGRGRIAKREWKLVGKQGSDKAGKALALREPHLKSANVALDAAKSGLERAQLNVSRTAIKAPFNAFVKEKSTDLGQLVTPQTGLGRLVGTDSFWVQVLVPVSHLVWLQIPDVTEGEASRAVVIQDAGAGVRIERPGRVVRLMGDLDPRGRMARVLVEIDDPFGLAESSSRAEGRDLPLLLGAYVRVEIDGRTLKNVFVLPRVALREGRSGADTVWLIDAEDKLRFRKIGVAWRGESNVYLRSGLTAGDRVIITRLAAPVEGMQLRTEQDRPDIQAAVPVESQR